MEQQNKHRWKVLIKRIKKSRLSVSTVMWGLFAKEAIPAGAYVVEYVGEILTAKEGD